MPGERPVRRLLNDLKKRRSCKVNVGLLSESLFDQFGGEVGFAEKLKLLYDETNNDQVKARIGAMVVEVMKEATKNDNPDPLAGLSDEDDLEGALEQLVRDGI